MKRAADRATPLDWEEVRRRLERAAENAARMTPERAQAVLEERARLLARVPTQPGAGETSEFLTFGVAGERYAIAASYVREVIRLTEPTPVPGTPAYLAGVINLRGEIVAVFDPRPFFGLANTAEAKPSRIVILGGERVEFGLLVDVVHEVLPLRLADILAPSEAIAGPGREYLRGVTADALVVLDGSKLLADRRFFIDVSEERSV